MFLKNNKIALTFDVELWSESDWLKPFITEDLKKDDKSFEKSISKILNTLKIKGFHATFFITDTVAKKFPNIVKEIANNGHEIASHGVGHTRIFESSYEEYAPLFKKHIHDLEIISGKKVHGFRAPHFSLKKESSWIIKLLTEMGIVYDSSIFPIKTPEYGNSYIPPTPYFITPENIFSENDSGILEIPVAKSSIFFIPFPFSGGIYFRILPFCIFSYFIKKELRKNKIPVLFFHPHEIESTTPQIKNGPFLKRKLKYYGTDNSFKKFEKILNCYIFDSIENIFIKK